MRSSRLEYTHKQHLEQHVLSITPDDFSSQVLLSSDRRSGMTDQS